MTDLVNNSGQGSNTPVLDIVSKRFNWGAFWFTWIWGLCNRTYITLVIFPIAILTLIPFVGGLIQLGCCIWFGIKGNEWAWQNKKWDSIEHFHEVQKIWAIAGTIVVGVLGTLMTIGIIAAMTMPVLLSNTEVQMEKTMRLKAINTATEVAMMNEALDNKCKFTSEGLAKCFAKRMNVNEINDNQLDLADGTTWVFEGDGLCVLSDNCKIDVENKGKLIVTIPVKRNDKGFVMVDSVAIENYTK